jgi:peptidoglycan hydrolase-like protein with peptidoglycan-binding domain
VARQAARGGRAASAAFGSGVLGRVVERAFENPAASGGLLVMAVTAGAIAVNATFLQGGDHLRPVLSPRAPAHTSAPSIPPVPTPRPQDNVTSAPLPPLPVSPPIQPSAATAAPTQLTTLTPPSPIKPSAAPARVPVPTAPDASPTVISGIQQELTRLGLYSGPIDGIAGARTKTAIATYQAGAGVAADGAPSAALLALMKAPPAPRPTASLPVPSKPATSPLTTAAAPVVAPAKPVPVPPAAIPATTADAATADTYRKVQTALNQIGYGPIPVDGKAGKTTADAIRRFELDNGLAMDGVANDAVVKRLTAIGALASR